MARHDPTVPPDGVPSGMLGPKMKPRDSRRRRRSDCGVVLGEDFGEDPSRDIRSTSTKPRLPEITTRTDEYKPANSTSRAVRSIGIDVKDDVPSPRRPAKKPVSRRRAARVAGEVVIARDPSLWSIGSWCEQEPPRERKLALPEAPMPPSESRYQRGLITPPLTPIISRLSTPDIEPIALPVEFCACCGDPEDKINDIWYLTGRSKIDSQCGCIPETGFDLAPC